MPPKRKSAFTGNGYTLGGDIVRPRKRPALKQASDSSWEEENADEDYQVEDEDEDGDSEYEEEAPKKKNNSRKGKSRRQLAKKDGVRKSKRTLTKANAGKPDQSGSKIGDSRPIDKPCKKAKEKKAGSKAKAAGSDVEDDGTPCDCDACKSIGENNPQLQKKASDIPYGQLRSSVKRGMYKYGEGQTLG